MTCRHTGSGRLSWARSLNDSSLTGWDSGVCLRLRPQGRVRRLWSHGDTAGVQQPATTVWTHLAAGGRGEIASTRQAGA